MFNLSLTYTSIISVLYLLTGVVSALSYVSQITAVWKSTDKAKDLSLLTWCLWTGCGAVSLVFTCTEIGKPLPIGLSALNFAGCLSVYLLALYKRKS